MRVLDPRLENAQPAISRGFVGVDAQLGPGGITMFAWAICSITSANVDGDGRGSALTAAAACRGIGSFAAVIGVFRVSAAWSAGGCNSAGGRLVWVGSRPSNAVWPWEPPDRTP